VIRLVGCLLVLGLGAFAQSEEPKISVNLDGFKYPPIARQARIRGVVVFELTAAGRKLLSESSGGLPILSNAAGENLTTWTLPPLATGRYLISYHFEFLMDGPCVSPRWEAIPIGNKFERFLRRLVRAKTETLVYRGYTAEDPSPTFTIAKGDDVKIDIFAGALSSCIQTEAAQVALNSHL
jgi:hypothetical protein